MAQRIDTIVPQAPEDGAKPRVGTTTTVHCGDIVVSASIPNLSVSPLNTELNDFRRLWNDKLHLPMMNDIAWEEVITSTSNDFQLNVVLVASFTCDGRLLISFVWKDESEPPKENLHTVYLLRPLPEKMAEWMRARLNDKEMTKKDFDLLSEIYSETLEA
ncbi:uncharacterized protein BDZ99DRAFT_467198 [Mytilinidion resinicola]|uniref:Uncharacterized protein n=1 Tax=Mytilinidion resinicola TaxID=574789 RepID=A0A6A6Y822_9PEZI|nr:uncharacterized protein BDZ99DRAFT_467198 [Mytilinidion resinicola]KAF2804986.1 hypothetical protein BDZ99DRAFT_467198 [Mytilinidion resinicola]